MFLKDKDDYYPKDKNVYYYISIIGNITTVYDAIITLSPNLNLLTFDLNFQIFQDNKKEKRNRGNIAESII